MDETRQTLSCRCCIAGGGPAGMMLGFLLARAGVDVDRPGKARTTFCAIFAATRFIRRRLNPMYELGLLDDFLKRPHQEVRLLDGRFGADTRPIADFTRLPTHCKFIALMPQWDFLNFLIEQGRRFPASGS